MPYEKNKTAYQDDEWFVRQRNILDVRNWNRDLGIHKHDNKTLDLLAKDSTFVLVYPHHQRRGTTK